jgi:hypothetical protein
MNANELRTPRVITYFGGPADGQIRYTDEIFVASQYDGSVGIDEEGLMYSWTWVDGHGYDVVADMAFYTGVRSGV